MGKELQKEGRQDELESISNLLSILEVKHFYITGPQFVIRSSLDELVLAVIRELGVRDKQELEYDSLLQDLFQVEQQQFTHTVSLKPHIGT